MAPNNPQTSYEINGDDHWFSSLWSGVEGVGERGLQLAFLVKNVRVMRENFSIDLKPEGEV